MLVTLKIRDLPGNRLDLRWLQRRIDWQTQHLARCLARYGKIFAASGWESSIHWKIGDERIEVAAGMNSVLLQFVVKIIPRDRIVLIDENRKVSVVGDEFRSGFQATDPLYSTQIVSV